MLKSHAVAIDESNTMNHPTPQGLSPQTAEDYLRGRYGAYRGHFAWRELEEAFNAGLRAQAASVEPVGKIIISGGNTGSLPEHPLLVWLGGVPPVGTELYAGAPPAPASVQDEALVEKLAKRTCEANADSARFTIALQTLRASLDPDDWMGAVTMHNYIDTVLAGGSPLQHPTPSPAQAVDAVDELREALRGLLASGGVIADASPDELQAALSDPESEPIVKTQAAAVLRARAALQASRHPQAQHDRGDLSIYKARWCFALAESDDWTYAVCKWDGADWLPIKTEDDLRIFDAALATKEPK